MPPRLDLDPGSLTAGNGKWGQSDLAGNVWEWTFDPFGQYMSGTCTDCVGTSGSDRVVRGGSFDAQAPLLRAAYRGAFAPANPYPYVGARCARNM